MGSDEDRFARVRGLKPGEPANFVYARDFDANEVELRAPPTCSRRSSREESLSFKGAPTTRLCCARATARSSSSAWRRPTAPRHATRRRHRPNRRRRAEGEDDHDLDHPSDGPTPKRRRRDSAAAAEIGTPAAAENGNGTPPPRTAPRASRPHRVRRGCLPPRARPGGAQTGRHEAPIPAPRVAGADVDRDADAAWAASLDDTEFGEESVRTPARIHPRRTRRRRSTSRAEIHGLGRVPRFGAATAGGIDEEYLEHAMDIAVVTAQGNGWELGAIPGGAVANAMVADGFPAAATAKALATFCCEWAAATATTTATM